jgi:Glycosyl transferases group 1
MRIAYIAPYKGPTLVQRRPVVKNLSLSSTIKIELIAQLLRSRSHEVDIISLGEVVEPGFRFYPAYYETKLFHPEISIYYASALPVRFIRGFWSSTSMLRHFQRRHRAAAYDIAIVFNLMRAHIACANYATRRLGLPVVLEYEDDSFVDVVGRAGKAPFNNFHRDACARVINSVCGGIAVSPHLLSQLPTDVPKLLLRGVLGDDVVSASKKTKYTKKNWVLFSGTHIQSNGVGELIEAWGIAEIPGWELHITGHGQLTDKLKQLAAKNRSIKFHGLVSRGELVDLLASAKICINPHAVSKTPGNVFAFKIIEYLGAGAHVLTTPMGALEKEIEAGVTYMPDNSPGTIAVAIKRVIQTERWKQAAAHSVHSTYGSAAVADSLDALLQRILKSSDKAFREPSRCVLSAPSKPG